VWVEWLQEDEILNHIGAFAREFQNQPIVAVTRRDAGNVRRLLGTSITQVVWPEELPHAFWPAVQRAQTHVVLRALATTIEQTGSLPRCLRTGLASAFRSDPPVRSVSLLAAELGCDRRTLWRQWHQTVGASSGLRMEDVLTWLILLRALGRKLPSKGWSTIASELGVHETTLSRAAKRLLGQTLRTLAPVDLTRLETTFSEQVLSHLIRNNP
jgi:hypothetical protein